MLGRTVIARTNKATVYREADGSVAKQYHAVDAVERVRQDEHSLGYLSRALPNARDADGWRYAVVRALRSDLSSGTIWLERATGQAVVALPSSALADAECRVGRWLAIYHNRLFGHADEGPVFADTNVHNILVDPVAKVVLGIDPGSDWGRLGTRYEDVIRHAYSLIVVLLQRRLGPMQAVRAFLRGYGASAEVHISAGAYAMGLWREARRTWAHYGLRSKPKQLLFAAGIVLLAPLFAIYVPAVLGRAMRETKNRVDQMELSKAAVRAKAGRLGGA